MKFKFILLGLFYTAILNAQITVKPNLGFTTHPTLVIEKIEQTEKQTQITFSLSNKSDQIDQFCIDKNTFINANNQKIELKNASGISICPKNTFLQPSQSLSFSLNFPALPKNIKFIDIQEPCTEFCVSIVGIVLDEKMNKQIDEAYNQYHAGNLNAAAGHFQHITQDFPDYPYGIWMYNLISILKETGNSTEVIYWTDQLLNSTYKDKAFYIEKLRDK